MALAGRPGNAVRVTPSLRVLCRCCWCAVQAISLDPQVDRLDLLKKACVSAKKQLGHLSEDGRDALLRRGNHRRESNLDYLPEIDRPPAD
jgi:hypothetical protein